MTDMTKQTEAISTERALKLALEALEIERNVPRLGPVPTKTSKAITALREALTSVPDWASEAKEQPAPATELREQEPVAWLDPWTRNNVTTDYDAYGKHGIPLYTSPQAQQEPKKDLMYSTVAMQERHAAFVDRAVATLEQAKREALALVNEVDQEQPAQQEFVCSTGLCYYKAQQQEPVAWLRKSDLVELRACNYMRLGADSPSIWAPNAPDEPSPDMELVAVYTSPPAQRTWVHATEWRGLTDEDIASLDLSAVTVKDAISDVRAVEAKLKEKNT